MKTKAMHELEKERLSIQDQLDSAKSRSSRNKMGQFATPSLLAEEIVQFALQQLTKSREIRFLDPALGTGAFYSAFLRNIGKVKWFASGIEVDPYYGKPSEKLWASTGLSFCMRDFTECLPPTNEVDKFNLIICNPPYVRHHHIESEKKEALKKRLSYLGHKISGLAGLYCYFLLLSDVWIQKDGISIWLIPNEFMDVNYGKTIKEYLTYDVELIRIHRFAPEDVQFCDALVSSTVVAFRKKTPDSQSMVSLSFGGSLKKPLQMKRMKQSSMNPSMKWSLLSQPLKKTPKNRILLGDLFTIKRGLATGDNNFFILTEEQIRERRLTFDFFTPVLPSPRFLPQFIVEADENGFPKVEQKLFLFDCDQMPERLKSTYPILWKYIEEGITRGIPKGYICGHRTPWYSQEHRPPALFISAYIGRNTQNKPHPFRFILNRSKATVTNSYLALYPTTFLKEVLKEYPKHDMLILDYLNSISPELLVEEGRVYGGGMYKLEPKEMARVGADALAEKLNCARRFSNQLLLF